MSVITNNTIQPSSGQSLTIKDEGGTASITVATNGEATFAENLKITNGKGIDFTSVASGGNYTADSNLLDDYEYGDFEIVLRGSNSGTLNTHAYQKYGTYTRIGSLVHLSGYVNIESGGDEDGNILLDLPYPIPNNVKYKGSGVCVLWSVNNKQGGLLCQEGTSTAMLVTFTFTAITHTDFSNDEEISFGLTYNID